ncbi:MAG: hypothetical protein ABR517_07960 [Thermoanaerobaculia bacterium]
MRPAGIAADRAGICLEGIALDPLPFSSPVSRERPPIRFIGHEERFL